MHVKQKEGKFETIIIIIVMKNSLDSSRKKSRNEMKAFGGEDI